MSDELNQRVKQMLIDVLKLDKSPSDIADDAPLFGAGLGLDSLDALQLAVSVEETFGVPIADESAGKQAFGSVSMLATYIRAQVVA